MAAGESRPTCSRQAGRGDCTAAGESRPTCSAQAGRGAAWRLRKAALRVLHSFSIRVDSCYSWIASVGQVPVPAPARGGWGKPPYVFSAGRARGCMAAGGSRPTCSPQAGRGDGMAATESRPTCSPQAGRGDGMAATESRPTCSPFILHSCGFVLFVDSERRAGFHTCPTLYWISASRAAGRLDGSERPYIIRSERRNGALLQPHDTHARRLRIVRNPLSRRPGAGNETH